MYNIHEYKYTLAVAGGLLLTTAPACFEDTVFGDIDGTETGDGDPGDGDPGDGDPGDGDPGDGLCGDGIVEGDEACDDGNPTNGDACTNACTVAVCGDSIIQTGVEECDAGADNGPGNACTSVCLANVCGDGELGPAEGCDDGNNSDADECTSACALADCGDGIVGIGEQCDDGNDVDTDDCLSTCTAAGCGDGHVWLDYEECDDGGLQNNDGCNAQCEKECIPAQQPLAFNFENGPPGNGQPLTMTAPASSMGAPFSAADFRWTEDDGYYWGGSDHGVQSWDWALDGQVFNGRGLETTPGAPITSSISTLRRPGR